MTTTSTTNTTTAAAATTVTSTTPRSENFIHLTHHIHCLLDPPTLH